MEVGEAVEGLARVGSTISTETQIQENKKTQTHLRVTSLPGASCGMCHDLSVYTLWATEGEKEGEEDDLLVKRKLETMSECVT